MAQLCNFQIPNQLVDILQAYDSTTTLKHIPSWGTFCSKDGVYATLFWPKTVLSGSNTEPPADIEFTFAGSVQNGGSIVDKPKNGTRQMRSAFEDSISTKSNNMNIVNTVICTTCGVEKSGCACFEVENGDTVGFT